MPAKKKLTKEETTQKWSYNHISGNLLDLYYLSPCYIAIPTNGEVLGSGQAVMGAGLAATMRKEIPELSDWLGRRLSLFGNHVQIFPMSRVITIPTKEKWKDKADLKLIERSLSELENLLHHDRKHYGGRINHVYLPRLGCGNGGLEWRDVEPLVAKWLGNSSYYTIVSLPEEYNEHYGRVPDRQIEGDNAVRRRGKPLHPDF